MTDELELTPRQQESWDAYGDQYKVGEPISAGGTPFWILDFYSDIGCEIFAVVDESEGGWRYAFANLVDAQLFILKTLGLQTNNKPDRI